MSPIRPTRATTAGRAYLDLQKLARATGRPTIELHQLYALECLVERIARSPHASSLVLKGGLLLAAFSARRPTQDIDLAARTLSADAPTVLSLMQEIAAVAIDDGVEFVATGATAEIIREEAPYNAVRVSMPARLSSAKLNIQVDVNVGDPIAPMPRPSTCLGCWADRSRSSVIPSPWCLPRSWSLRSNAAPRTRAGATSSMSPCSLASRRSSVANCSSRSARSPRIEACGSFLLRTRSTGSLRSPSRVGQPGGASTPLEIAPRPHSPIS